MKKIDFQEELSTEKGVVKLSDRIHDGSEKKNKLYFLSVSSIFRKPLILLVMKFLSLNQSYGFDGSNTS